MFNLPPWALGASSGDALTYSNVARAEPLPGRSQPAALDRADRAGVQRPTPTSVPAARTSRSTPTPCCGPTRRSGPSFYEKAIAGGWLTVDEVRAREDLPPLDR